MRPRFLVPLAGAPRVKREKIELGTQGFQSQTDEPSTMLVSEKIESADSDLFADLSDLEAAGLLELCQLDTDSVLEAQAAEVAGSFLGAIGLGG